MSDDYDGDDMPCPHCGEPLAADATFCRHCGASEELGWGLSAGEFHGESAMEEEFDYDEFLEREFPAEAARKPIGFKKALYAAIVIVLIISFIWMTIM